MLFFPAYAFLVWYFAVKHRRRPLGLVAVVLGLVGILGISFLHVKIRDWSNGAIQIESAQFLLYTYAVLVFGMGLFFVALPRGTAVRWREVGACQGCGYDLRSLEPDTDTRCPECGKHYEPPPPEYDVAGSQQRKWSVNLSETLGGIDHDRIQPPTRTRAEARKSLLDRAGRDTREAAKHGH
ncbi:MAG: hypothetical protein EA378_07670 [Phycisphaerales bacterium]|nr:MAG: hypothetical protein EA378_07670 [Phycisphaerales bacterium]